MQKELCKGAGVNNDGYDMRLCIEYDRGALFPRVLLKLSKHGPAA